MILPLQGFDDSRPRKYAAWPPDLPRDQEREDVDYDSMFDLFYLKRNNKGDNFFDDIQTNTYFVTPRGIVLKRCGPRGWNPEFPHLKSLKRIGYPIPSGYWQAKVGAGRSVMIHHLVYAAFGDISLWDGIRLDHTPDRTKTNNYIHNLQPSDPQSDAYSKQARLHTPGVQLYRNNTSGVTGLRWCDKRDKPGWHIKLVRDKEVVFQKWLMGDEYPNNAQGKRDAIEIIEHARQHYLGVKVREQGGGDVGGGAGAGAGGGE